MTQAQVMTISIPPKATPITPCQHASAQRYNITQETAARYNWTVHYINNKLANTIPVKQIWKQSRGRRYGNITNFTDDCLHLNMSGKVHVVSNIIKSMTNL